MKIAENFEQFMERVTDAEANPNMTAEEWAQTKSEFMVFLFSALLKEQPELMNELGGHVWNALQEAP